MFERINSSAKHLCPGLLPITQSWHAKQTNSWTEIYIIQQTSNDQTPQSVFANKIHITLFEALIMPEYAMMLAFSNFCVWLHEEKIVCVCREFINDVGNPVVWWDARQRSWGWSVYKLSPLTTDDQFAMFSCQANILRFKLPHIELHWELWLSERVLKSNQQNKPMNTCDECCDKYKLLFV